MKTLDEYNREQADKMAAVERLFSRAGVSCPECGDEMQFASREALTGLPPKRLVICPMCKRSGYMIQ